MEIPITRQLIEAAAAIALGVAVGVLYDVFRVVRSRITLRAVTAVCDFLFCIVAGVALFALGMTVGGGRNRIALGVLGVLGGSLYFLTMSRLMLPILRAVADGVTFALYFLTRPIAWLWNVNKKFTKSAKKHFIYAVKWYTIPDDTHIRRKTYRKEPQSSEKNRVDNENRVDSSDRSARGGHYQYTRQESVAAPTVSGDQG